MDDYIPVLYNAAIDAPIGLHLFPRSTETDLSANIDTVSRNSYFTIEDHIEQIGDRRYRSLVRLVAGESTAKVCLLIDKHRRSEALA